MLCRDCFSRHFQEQVKLYGQQVIINLVDQKVRQQSHYVFMESQVNFAKAELTLFSFDPATH